MTPPPLTTSRHSTRSTLSPQASATSRPASGGAPPVPQQPSPHGKRRVTRDLDARLDSGSQGVSPFPPPTSGGTGNTHTLSVPGERSPRSRNGSPPTHVASAAERPGLTELSSGPGRRNPGSAIYVREVMRANRPNPVAAVVSLPPAPTGIAIPAEPCRGSRGECPACAHVDYFGWAELHRGICLP